ncbi:hypothetical protein Tco_1092095, partial [Tanacetum coccineum]
MKEQAYNVDRDKDHKSSTTTAISLISRRSVTMNSLQGEISKANGLGKDFSNSLMADSLPKTIWLSMHHVVAIKHWLFQSKRLLVFKKLKLKKHEVSTASTSVSTGGRVTTISSYKDLIRLGSTSGIRAGRETLRADDENPPPLVVTPTQQAPHTVSTIKLHILKKDTNGQIKVLPPKTAEEILARERERKARTTLLMAIPEDHLENFHKITDVKEMREAIKYRFGGNDESKKMFQSLLSQLEIHGAGVSTEDANQKFLRSLPSSWSQVSLIMRTKPGVDNLSFDDLYNNLKVFETDVKGSTGSSSSAQNVAFVSSKSTSSTNDVSTAYGATTSSGYNSQRENTSSYTDELMHSFFANQSSGPQLDHEDLEQIDGFDLEEIDLKWQGTLLESADQKGIKISEGEMQGTLDIKQKIIGGDLENRRNLKLWNLDAKKQLLMYSRFVQGFLNNQLSNLHAPLDNLPIPVLTKKVFTNMAKKGLNFLGHVTPLFPNMLAQAVVDEGEGLGQPTEPQPTPSPTQPSTGDLPPVTESSYRHDTTQDPRVNLEGIGGSKGGQVQSSNDRSHSGGNTSARAKGGLNLQVVKDMKKKLGKKEFVSKQGRKNAKPEPILDDSAFDNIDADLAHGVSTVVPEVSTVVPEVNISTASRPKVSTATLMTPPTTTSVFDNKDITLAETLVKMKDDKAKLKGVAIKEV